MHIIAILANLILLILVAALIVVRGLPDNGEAMAILIAAIVAPAFSTIALWRRNGPIFELISLEIEARKATLRQRIAEAEANTAGKSIGG